MINKPTDIVLTVVDLDAERNDAPPRTARRPAPSIWRTCKVDESKSFIDSGAL